MSPILVRIIDRDLFPRFYTFGNQNYTLGSEPVESLELAVRYAGMVHKLCVIAHITLVDLVSTISCLALHDILIPQVFGD